MSNTAALAPLTLDHLTLDAEDPYRALTLSFDQEYLLYALVGRLRVYVNGRWVGTMGGRQSVTTPLAHVVRLPAGQETALTLLVEGVSADALLASVGALENRVTKIEYWHVNDTPFHQVGTGTHGRRVGEVPLPPGFVLSCGETFQEAGMVSSWPPHATAEDMGNYAESKTTWQEVFYCVCPAPALAMLQGLYPGNRSVSEVRPIQNGEIIQMPLGAHSIHSHPSSWTWYFWCYTGNALKKQYNVNSLDVGTYRQ